VNNFAPLVIKRWQYQLTVLVVIGRPLQKEINNG
jgi:hypothetical protein